MIEGVIEIRENEIHIKELPIQTWTKNYKEFLESLMENDIDEI